MLRKTTVQRASRLLLAGLIFGLIVAADAAMVKGPYMFYTGKPGQMQILWQLDTTEKCSIAWGRDAALAEGKLETEQASPSHQHMAVLTGLKPGAHYQYRVTAGAESQSGSFNAAPDESAQDLKFFVYGDSRSNPGIHDSVCAAILKTITADPASQTIIFHTGDWVPGDTDANWGKDFFNRTMPEITGMQANLPIMGCRGNHENAGHYFRIYYPYPYVDGFYWSFDYGPAHFAILDQYEGMLGGVSEKQVEWLKKDLAASRKEWKFIMVHAPAVTAGNHGNDERLQRVLEMLRPAARVDAVFGGHNHNYARAVKDGILHVTTGGGGAKLYNDVKRDPAIAAFCKDNHFCQVAIKGSQFELRAVKPDGTLIDQVKLTHVEGGATRAEARPGD